MKLLIVFVSFVITLCAAASYSHKNTETLVQLTERVTEIIRNISVDVTTALSGEVNDLVLDNSSLPGELHDVITKLQWIKRRVPNVLSTYIEQVYTELKKLESALKLGEFLNVHPIIQSTHSYVTILKSTIH